MILQPDSVTPGEREFVAKLIGRGYIRIHADDDRHFLNHINEVGRHLLEEIAESAKSFN